MERARVTGARNGCICVERLKQWAYVLDTSIHYSRRLDAHSGLQEIAELVKTCIQEQIKECEHCEGNRRNTAEVGKPADGPCQDDIIILPAI